MSPRARIWNCGVLLVLWCWPLAVWGQAPAGGVVDFQRDIEPILKRHCYSCHGPQSRQGGLRLDQQKAAQAGGFSRNPVLGGTLETNELWLRVSSTDATFRMPKRAEALSTPELNLIQRWVSVGTPWPDQAALAQQKLAQERARWWSQEAWLDFLERWLTDVPFLIPFLVTVLACQVLLLGIERYKDGQRQGHAWVQAPWARRFQWLGKIGLPHYLLFWVAAGWILTGLAWRGEGRKVAKVREELEQLRSAQQRSLAVPTVQSLYGNPPIPHRPQHPPTLQPTYYRGNCERNPMLFNGGNYRTATFLISIVTQEGKQIQVGDVVPDGGLRLRLNLERPPGTTKSLYTSNIIQSIFLSQQVFSELDTPVVQPFTHLKTITPDWKWETDFDLQGPFDDAQRDVSGLIYLYQGHTEPTKARGTMHYGIKYDLKFEKRRVLAGSEVWMGVLFTPPVVELPQSGKLPLKEWFGHEAIPIMTGKNTTDPTLLGIPEHADKQASPAP